MNPPNTYQAPVCQEVVVGKGAHRIGSMPSCGLTIFYSISFQYTYKLCGRFRIATLKMRKSLILVVLLTCALAVALAVHLRSLDGLDGLLFGTLLSEDTVYAPGYSDSGFRKVRPGMSVAEVYALLGAPLEQWTIAADSAGPDMGQRWSRSPGDTHYRCRVVLYYRGTVVEKHSEFYVD